MKERALPEFMINGYGYKYINGQRVDDEQFNDSLQNSTLAIINQKLDKIIDLLNKEEE